jgi:hypothetical protein
MHFYFGKHIQSTKAGARLVRVACARCECEYFYNLTRIGIGHGEAPYYIGVARATRSAEKGAQKDLERRLTREAELVPCPNCNWINDELVAGYRIVRYRFLGTLARVTLVIGIILTVTFGTIGAFLDPAGLVYFLILPVGILLFAGAVYGLQFWMRSRIQPNRDFPLAPRLPPGSPPALRRHPETGALYRAKPPSVTILTAEDWCDFQLGRHQLPFVCCGCLQPASVAHGYNAVTLIVPRCQQCAADSKRTYWRVFYSVALTAWLVLAAVLLTFNLQAEEFWIFTSAAIVVALIVAAVVASRKTAPVKIASGDRSRGVIRLRFRNVNYAQVVAQHVSGVSG